MNTQTTTWFRYKLRGAEPTYRENQWLQGSYTSHGPMTLAAVLRRLSASWKKSGPTVYALELTNCATTRETPDLAD